MLSRIREAMKHIGESFRVHQAVLVGNAQKSFGRESVRFAGEREKASVESVVNQVAESLDVVAYFGERGPIAGLIGGQAAADGVNAKGEELVERRRARFQGKQVGAKKIPVKGLEMTDVKDDAMAFGDGPFVEGILANSPKEAVRIDASFQNSAAELV
jgi:hypothetical protein